MNRFIVDKSFLISSYSPLITLLSVLICSPNFPLIVIDFVIAVLLGLAFAVVIYNTFLNSSEHSSVDYLNNLNTKKYLKYAIPLSIISVLSFRQHDYIYYLRQWKIILDNKDPWIETSNAYGPIHNIFAPLISINPMIPKLIFFIIYFYALYIVTFKEFNFDSDLNTNKKLILFILYGFCPFSVLTVIVYGNNDALSAALMALSLTTLLKSNSKKENFFSGVLLGISSMIKFYPLIISPAFFWRKRTIDYNFLKGFVISILTICLASYKVWGSTILTPILFATDRSSKHLSFFNFVRSTLSIDLDHLSIYLVVIVFVASVLFTQLLEFDLIPSVLFLFGSVLSVYKVGHPQFFIFFFCLGPLIVRYVSSMRINRYHNLIFSYTSWISFLNFYLIIYHLTCGMREGASELLRQNGSIIYITISIILLSFIIRGVLIKPKLFTSIK